MALFESPEHRNVVMPRIESVERKIDGKKSQFGRSFGKIVRDNPERVITP